jgi:hypothetical protein
VRDEHPIVNDRDASGQLDDRVRGKAITLPAQVEPSLGRRNSRRDSTYRTGEYSRERDIRPRTEFENLSPLSGSDQRLDRKDTNDDDAQQR